MAGDPRKRQKKLMKRRRKDKERKSRQIETPSFSAFSPKKKLKQARTFPIHECMIDPAWKETGMAPIVLSRLQPDGRLTVGSYLVDLGCLGLKDTFCLTDMSKRNYEVRLHNRFAQGDPPVPCSLALAHRIIYGGIEYAARFGFKPDKDFDESQYVLEAAGDVEPPEEAVEFGKNGKPFYVQGPHDNADWVIRQLDKTAGPGNYHYICATDGIPDEFLEKELEPAQVDLLVQAKEIVRAAQSRIPRIVQCGEVVFFSTDTGDAWMLDPEDNSALELAQDGDPLPYAIKETPEGHAVEYTARFDIEDDLFIVAERSGRIRKISGYPVLNILEACQIAREEDDAD